MLNQFNFKHNSLSPFQNLLFLSHDSTVNLFLVKHEIFYSSSKIKSI